MAGWEHRSIAAVAADTSRKAQTIHWGKAVIPLLLALQPEQQLSQKQEPQYLPLPVQQAKTERAAAAAVQQAMARMLLLAQAEENPLVLSGMP